VLIGTSHSNLDWLKRTAMRTGVEVITRLALLLSYLFYLFIQHHECTWWSSMVQILRWIILVVF